MSKAPSSSQRLAQLRRKLRQWYELNRSFIGDGLARYEDTGEERDYPALEQTFRRDYSPCFVLSTGRCGTEFLTHVLALAPELVVHHKPTPDLRFEKQRLHDADADSLREVALATRFEPLFAAFLAGRTFVETNNAITFLAPALAELFPRSRFVHLLRHPGDFARSGMRRGWYTGSVETDIGILQNTADPEWPQRDRLAKIGWLWNETQRFIGATLERVDPSRTLVVKSEELFRERAVVEELFRFLEVPTPSGARLERRAQSPANRQVLGSFPSYREWSADQKASLATFLELHTRYGYELGV